VIKKEKILLYIDTDDRAAQTVKEVSCEDKRNIKVVCAENGQDGLDIAREILPDLVIIKRNVPMLDALSFSVLFRQTKRTASIPVIVMCHQDITEEEYTNLIDAGCSGCMQSPLDRDELAKVIEKWIKS
jgi:DNA-binding response OmpR family regulator